MNSAGYSTSKNPILSFERDWNDPGTLPDFKRFFQTHPELTSQQRVQICLIDQSCRWKLKSPLPVEEYASSLRQNRCSSKEIVRVIVEEFRFQEQAGQKLTSAEFISRFPDLASELHAALVSHPENFESSVLLTPPSHHGETAVHAFGEADLPPLAFDAKNIPTYVPKQAVDAPHEQPDSIGRYRILRVLGDGGFGRVYLAKDSELGRNVAIKVPHPSRVAKSSDVDAYLGEARIVAQLDHPAIVPVFDCGRTSDGRCFAVSKFIEGCDLSTKLKRTPLTFAATAQLLHRVAQGLHYAHLKGVVHRDIKPGNILLDTNDHPFIADFGIAMKEEDYGRGQAILGTVPYMSPEQLRGEGHLVDGRSDIFSLGVTMYEMLTGRRPFPSSRHSRDLTAEPRPLRQIDDSIPQELERICLKAMATRVVDRYNTALDFSLDLELYLKGPVDPTNRPLAAIPAVTPGLSGTPSKYTSGQAPSENWPAIVPKGLRSFDRDDSSFFLQLLPGPRDREGIPESVLFWRNLIAELDPDQTFRVGLIYGPSGCGKSSFMKAGVLPRLPSNVTSIYIECTPLETEARLLRALYKHVPELPGEQSLVESLSAIRRGHVLARGKKLVLVLDQFEQYLHAHDSQNWNDLLLALRQSDGEHVQCILGVRDDFWMAVTHFMDELEVPFVRGQNVSAIDLFGLSHARKVLTAIGQAYSALPFQHSEITQEQKSFVTSAVQELSKGERVVPVHLALFAEMVKDKRWSVGTLTELGGIAGIGVTFLEETFNGTTASPIYRLHQKAARKVLKALLSEGDTDIKGAMRSHTELLTASGYEDNPRDFETLIRILDSELRLITPTDPEGLETGDLSESTGLRGRERFYHLTHDYLVPSLRDWLTRKQKETRRGRAELLLADRAAGYHIRKRARNLPSLLEWFDFLLFIPKRSRQATAEQRELLKGARRYYSGWIVGTILVMFVTAWSLRQATLLTRATLLVDSLKTAETSNVPEIEQQIRKYSYWTEPLVSKLISESPPGSLALLHASMSAKHLDEKLQKVLLDGLNFVSPSGFADVCQALEQKGNPRTAVKELWDCVQDPASPPSDRFRTGLALVRLAPPNVEDPTSEWSAEAPFLADQLVEEVKLNPESFGPWNKELKPIRKLLYPRLYSIFSPNSESDQAEVDRVQAANLLGDLYRDDPARIVSLILDSDPEQYSSLQQHLLNSQFSSEIKNELFTIFNQPIPHLELETPPDRKHPEFKPAVEQNQRKLDEYLRHVRRKAYSAAALLEFDETGPILSVLSPAESPDLQSHAEDRLSRLGTRPATLMKLMQSESNVKTQAALIRSLAGMDPGMISPDLRTSLGGDLIARYKSHPDSGIHSAAEWFLRRHGFQDQVQLFVAETNLREASPDRSWYINPVGETMVVFKGPITTVTGSPEWEIGHESNETLVERVIPRTFAISTTEVKYIDFVEFRTDFKHKDNEAFEIQDSPAALITWDWATRYCNYLSRKANIPDDQLCYEEPIGTTRAYPDYLHRTGYRLPTEAEWEHACRAGTNTSFFWGNATSLSSRYSATLENSKTRSWPSTRTCPNLAGLFGTSGNVSEMIQETYRENLLDFNHDDEYDPIPKEGLTAAEKPPEAILRGGSSTSQVDQCRAGNRTESSFSGLVSSKVGFRICRTINNSP